MAQENEQGNRDSDDDPPCGTPAAGDRVLRAEDLVGPSREVWIDLDGVRYRLRITRRGKLILQK